MSTFIFSIFQKLLAKLLAKKGVAQSQLNFLGFWWQSNFSSNWISALTNLLNFWLSEELIHSPPNRLMIQNTRHQVVDSNLTQDFFHVCKARLCQRNFSVPCGFPRFFLNFTFGVFNVCSQEEAIDKLGGSFLDSSVLSECFDVCS